MPFLPMALAALSLLQGGKNLIKPTYQAPPGAPLGGGSMSPSYGGQEQQQMGGSGLGQMSLGALQLVDELRRQKRENAVKKQAELEAIASLRPYRPENIGT